MRWMRWDHEGHLRLGRIEGDAVVVCDGDLFDTPRETGERVALADIPADAWRAPCAPRQVVGLWNNFRAAAAKNGWAEPADPLYFLKSPHSVAGHGVVIEALPPEAGRVFYEGELAVVIGRRAHRVARDDAAAFVFGYACANDVTAFELLNRDASFPQWTRAKSFPCFGAFGPWIDTGFDPAAVPAAALRTRVGGRERQNFPLSDMFFGPLELVHRISQDLVLEPGDVILCGTSLGALPMKPGTAVEVEIDGLGTLLTTYG